MTNQAKSDEKVLKPSTHFREPHEVVTDSSLSKDEKVAALETLEQDSRQMSEAAAEGMAGGELNKLHDVLVAKDELVMPPVAAAYEMVLTDLRARRSGDPTIETRIQIHQATAALERLVAVFAQESYGSFKATAA